MSNRPVGMAASMPDQCSTTNSGLSPSSAANLLERSVSMPMRPAISSYMVQGRDEPEVPMNSLSGG